MFTTLPMPQLPPHNRGYSSYTPSPLSSSPTRPSSPLLHPSHHPRQTHSSPILPSDPNTNPFSFTSITPTHSSNHYPRHPSTNSPPRKRKDQAHIAFSKRPVKMNPLLHGTGNGEGKGNSRETRRKLFLKRVREDSEEKRWRDRGGDDELLRTIWVAEERRRVERKEREGNFILSSQPESEEEEEEIIFSSSMRSIDEEMADEVAQQEDAEMEAMLAMMEGESRDRDLDVKMESLDQDMDTPYGSDDDEYDSLLIDAVQAVEGHQSASFQERNHGGGDMDMMDES